MTDLDILEDLALEVNYQRWQMQLEEVGENEDAAKDLDLLRQDKQIEWMKYGIDLDAVERAFSEEATE